MINNYKKFILIFLVLIIAFISTFFVYNKYFKKEVIIEPEKEVEFLTINIDETMLLKNENNFIYSSSLRPKFVILVPQNIDIESLSLKLDNSENILTDKFYGETNIDKPKRNIIFEPSFMLTPQKHSLLVDYKNIDGKSSSMDFNFALVFKENFNEPLKNSKVWIIPEGRSPEWFDVQNGKLLAKPMTADSRSSLAFLYTFNGDARIDFELSPIENNVSLVFYFLEFGSFTIGSNNNKDIVLYRKNQPNLFGEQFGLLSGHRYHIYLARKNFKYELAIKELVNDEQVNPVAQFSDDNILLRYNDFSEQKLTVHNPNHIGFSLWQNSNGVFIDNIFITGFSDYKYGE